MATSQIHRTALARATQLTLVDGSCPRIGLLATGSRFESIAIAATPDPLRSIHAALVGRHLQTLHVVAHGRPGALSIGGHWITAADLLRDAAALAQWRVDRVALWSCELGADQHFLAVLSELTGAEIWASDAVLGRGERWQLNLNSAGTGNGDAPEAPFEESTLRSWDDSLNKKNQSKSSDDDDDDDDQDDNSSDDDDDDNRPRKDDDSDSKRDRDSEEEDVEDDDEPANNTDEDEDSPSGNSDDDDDQEDPSDGGGSDRGDRNDRDVFFPEDEFTPPEDSNPDDPIRIITPNGKPLDEDSFDVIRNPNGTIEVKLRDADPDTKGNQGFGDIVDPFNPGDNSDTGDGKYVVFLGERELGAIQVRTKKLSRSRRQACLEALFKETGKSPFTSKGNGKRSDRTSDRLIGESAGGPQANPGLSRSDALLGLGIKDAYSSLNFKTAGNLLSRARDQKGDERRSDFDPGQPLAFTLSDKHEPWTEANGNDPTIAGIHDGLNSL